MSIHVGIIDKDPVRLVTALLHRNLYAEKMIFIGVNDQLSQYHQLEKVLIPKGIETQFYLIPADIDLKGIKQKITELIEQLQTCNKEIHFNASCGERHRLLAVYEIFRTYHWPIYVIEPCSDELCWLYPERQPQQVEDHISISDCLTIFGARCEIQAEPIYQKLNHCITILGKKWASKANELGPGLATLNYLATTCRKTQCLSVALNDKQQSYQELGILIDDLQTLGLAQYQAGTLTFSTQEARRFANGEWLEWYVHHTVESIRSRLSTIQDCAIGVQVFRKIGEKEVRNELDVVAVTNNKLHIIECKTKGMDSDGDDTLYKLESIRDLLGGLQARALLVSFRPLRHYDVTRAMDLGLALIGPEQLDDLESHLYQWFIEAGGNKLEFS